MPTFYQCQRCTACCRWPGFVNLSATEITRIAAFLRLPEPEFIERYTRLREDRKGLALQERPGGDCIFLDGQDCTVQPVKPQQCRDFPNGWRFPGFERYCKAIPREVSDSEYLQLFRDATGRDPTPRTTP